MPVQVWPARDEVVNACNLKQEYLPLLESEHCKCGYCRALSWQLLAYCPVWCSAHACSVDACGGSPLLASIRHLHTCLQCPNVLTAML